MVDVSWMIKDLIAHAKSKRYKVKERDFMLVLERKGVLMTIRWTEKMKVGFIVDTTLYHPKHGKTSLQRRNIGLTEIKKIINWPRKHTGKGYYSKTT